MYQTFLLEIETPGVYQFQREIETSVDVERCLDEVALSEEQVDDWVRGGLFPGLQGTTDVELPAGTYRVDVQRQYAAPHPVWLRIVPNPG
jgi:hypothetical protein